MAEIGIISSSREMIDLSEELAGQLSVDVCTAEAQIADVEEAALKLKDQGVTCFLARGRVADIIAKQGFSVVSINPMAFDICEALKIAPSDADKVGVIVYRNSNISDAAIPRRVVEAMETITAKKIALSSYRNREELNYCMLQQIHQGVKWFIGTRVVVDFALRNGRMAVELLSGEETMLNAFSEAFNVLNNQKRVLKEAATLNNAIDIARQGVAAIDAAGIITEVNDHAVKLLSDYGFNMGASIKKFLPACDRVNRSGGELQDHISTVGSKRVIVNQRPLFLGQAIIGAVINIQDAGLIEELENKIRKKLTQKGLAAKWSIESIIGQSDAIVRVKQKAIQYAGTAFNILIAGDTGTGKEMFAQGIHMASKQCKGPFVAVNCSALPESLLESELFGYEEGAFTGAKKQGKPGFFELAHGGTIFLDEINSINQKIQAQLLRVIEEKRVMRLGGERLVPIDVRVLSASNQDLWESVRNNQFRSDLYYRINELELAVPPLRERLEDLDLLINFFFSKHEYYGPEREEIVKHIKQAMSGHEWPGNIRELENIVKRIIALVGQAPLPELLQQICSEFKPLTDKLGHTTINVSLGSLEDIESQIMAEIGSLYRYDLNKIASILGVSKSTAWRRLKKASAFEDN